MWRNSWIRGRELTLLIACVLVAVAASAVSPYFATVDKLTTVLRNIVELMIVGLGLTLLLAMGRIDVSIGLVLGFTALAVGNSSIKATVPSCRCSPAPSSAPCSASSGARWWFSAVSRRSSLRSGSSASIVRPFLSSWRPTAFRPAADANEFLSSHVLGVPPL